MNCGSSRGSSEIHDFFMTIRPNLMIYLPLESISLALKSRKKNHLIVPWRSLCFKSLLIKEDLSRRSSWRSSDTPFAIFLRRRVGRPDWAYKTGIGLSHPRLLTSTLTLHIFPTLMMGLQTATDIMPLTFLTLDSLQASMKSKHQYLLTLIRVNQITISHSSPAQMVDLRQALTMTIQQPSPTV